MCFTYLCSLQNHKTKKFLAYDCFQSPVSLKPHKVNFQKTQNSNLFEENLRMGSFLIVMTLPVLALQLGMNCSCTSSQKLECSILNNFNDTFKAAYFFCSPKLFKRIKMNCPWNLWLLFFLRNILPKCSTDNSKPGETSF